MSIIVGARPWCLCRPFTLTTVDFKGGCIKEALDDKLLQGKNDNSSISDMSSGNDCTGYECVPREQHGRMIVETCWGGKKEGRKPAAVFYLCGPYKPRQLERRSCKFIFDPYVTKIK
jgi:hypothetical protein